MNVLYISVYVVALAWPAAGAGCVAAVLWSETDVTLRPGHAAGTAYAEFRLCNSGRVPVAILAIKPGCDCVSAKADKAVYAPGEAGAIRVEMSLAGRDGRFERSIEVVTDDPMNRSTTLKVIVDLRSPVMVAARQVFWRVGEPAVDKDIEVAITDSDVHLGTLECADQTFQYRLEPVEGKQNGFRVRIRPNQTERIAQATIRLNASVKGQPRVFVLVAGVR